MATQSDLPALVVHPSREELAAFARGTLPGTEQSRVEQHVALCGECCLALREVPDDTLIIRLRGGETNWHHPFAREDSLPLEDSPEFTAPDSAVPAALANHPRYAVIRPLGAGGMGVIYLAEHRIMHRQVALKVVKPRLTGNALAVERFRQEVRAAARLAHRNIVTVHDADSAGELQFLVMEYVVGASLDRIVAARGALPVRHACHYVRQAALGLQHAHERGMVHRDVKPQNLMLARGGVVKILDFGLARFAKMADDEAQQAGLTRSGTILGTPDYMAPEQAADSRAAEPAADIYSLGCTLYFLLTGSAPFAAESPVKTLVDHQTKTPRSITAARADVPSELAGVIAGMMAKDPNARPASADDVARLLAPFATAAGGDPASGPAAVQTEPTLAHEPSQRDSFQDQATLADIAAHEVSSPPRQPANMAFEPLQIDDSRWLQDVVQPDGPWQPGRRSRPARHAAGLLIAVGGLGALVVLMLTLGVAWAVRHSGRPVAEVAAGGSDSDRGASASTIEAPTRNNSARDDARRAPPEFPAARILLVLPSRNFWYEDYRRIQAALAPLSGVTLEVASSAEGKAYPSHALREEPPVAVDVVLSSAAVDRYDAIVVIGAYPFASHEFVHDDHWRRIACDFLRRAHGRGACIAAICNGSAVLAKSGLLDGQEAATNEFMDDATLANQRVRWRARPVVKSGHVLTAGKPEESGQLVKCLLDELKQRPW